MDHSHHIHFRLPLNPPRSLQHDNLKQPWDLSNLMNKWPHIILTEIDVAEKSIDACSEADDVRAIAANDTDMTTVPGIASEEFSNSDLGDKYRDRPEKFRQLTRGTDVWYHPNVQCWGIASCPQGIRHDWGHQRVTVWFQKCPTLAAVPRYGKNCVLIPQVRANCKLEIAPASAT